MTQNVQQERVKVMGVFYVNCIGKTGVENKEECFHNIKEANDCFEQRVKETTWTHVEITEQLKVFLPETNERF